jgi:hypothetical protein
LRPRPFFRRWIAPGLLLQLLGKAISHSETLAAQRRVQYRARLSSAL